MKKILVVCTANLQRSPTLEAMLNATPTFLAKSAGLCPPKDRQPVTEELLLWADEIIVFELDQARLLRNRFWKLWPKLRVRHLDVPDDFAWFEPALVDLLRQRWFRHCGVWLFDPSGGPGKGRDPNLGVEQEAEL